jgi:hypothetical protein
MATRRRGEKRGSPTGRAGRGARRGTLRGPASPRDATPERPSGPAPGRGLPPRDVERPGPGPERDAGGPTQREVEPEGDEERQTLRP